MNKKHSVRHHYGNLTIFEKSVTPFRQVKIDSGRSIKGGAQPLIFVPKLTPTADAHSWKPKIQF